MKKCIVFCIIIILCTTFSFAQQRVEYSYDLAGNRITREIVLDPEIRTTLEEPLVFTERILEASLHIYPNPTEGLLKVEIKNIPDEQKMNIAFYDLRGNIILQKSNISPLDEIDISNQPAGTYLLKIESGDFKSEWKIIKK